MQTLLISISWEWALGILLSLSGMLIAIAWSANGRFTSLETSVDWIKMILKDLKVNSDNTASGIPAFSAHSPLNLTLIGETWLEESGLKKYIDSRPETFLHECQARKGENPYEVQKYAFRLLDETDFDASFEDALKKFVFEKGTTMGVLRRVGGIYLRDVCLNSFGWNRNEIDKHDPQKTIKEP